MHDDGRWYIGSTKETLDHRRHSHYAEATRRSPSRDPTKFHQHLAKTQESEWTWGVHEEFTDISQADLRKMEAAYQQAFDCLKDGGFNTWPAAKDPDNPFRLKPRWHVTHRVERNAKARARHQANKEHENAASREWHAANRDVANKKRKEAYHADVDTNRAKQRKYYEENKDAIKERAKARRVAAGES